MKHVGQDVSAETKRRQAFEIFLGDREPIDKRELRASKLRWQIESSKAGFARGFTAGGVVRLGQALASELSCFKRHLIVGDQPPNQIDQRASFFVEIVHGLSCVDVRLPGDEAIPGSVTTCVPRDDDVPRPADCAAKARSKEPCPDARGCRRPTFAHPIPIPTMLCYLDHMLATISDTSSLFECDA